MNIVLALSILYKHIINIIVAILSINIINIIDIMIFFVIDGTKMVQAISFGIGGIDIIGYIDDIGAMVQLF